LCVEHMVPYCVSDCLSPIGRGRELLLLLLLLMLLLLLLLLLVGVGKGAGAGPSSHSSLLMARVPCCAVAPLVL